MLLPKDTTKKNYLAVLKHCPSRSSIIGTWRKIQRCRLTSNGLKAVIDPTFKIPEHDEASIVVRNSGGIIETKASL